MENKKQKLTNQNISVISIQKEGAPGVKVRQVRYLLQIPRENTFALFQMFPFSTRGL